MTSCRRSWGRARTPNLETHGRRRSPHRHALRRALPDHPEAGLRWDGKRLSRRGPGARQARRDQDPRRPPRPRRAVRRALPPRGTERRRALAPEHRLDLRPRRLGGDVLHRDGVRRGADAEGAARRPRPVAARDRDRLHAPDPLGAPLRAPERDRPPRHQAAQRDRGRRGPREGDGLRHRTRRRGEPDDRGGLDHRDGAVPLARAGTRRSRRPDLRPLLHRDRALRAAHRLGAVHRRDARRDCDEAPLAGPRGALRPPARDPARPRLRRPASAREGSRRPLPLGGGDGLRPRADRPRDRRLRRDCRSGDDGPLEDGRRRGGDDDRACGRDGRDLHAGPVLRIRRAAAQADDLAVATRGGADRGWPGRRLVRLRGTSGSAQRDEAGRGARRGGPGRSSSLSRTSARPASRSLSSARKTTTE